MLRSGLATFTIGGADLFKDLLSNQNIGNFLRPEEFRAVSDQLSNRFGVNVTEASQDLGSDLVPGFQ